MARMIVRISITLSLYHLTDVNAFPYQYRHHYNGNNRQPHRPSSMLELLSSMRQHGTAEELMQLADAYDVIDQGWLQGDDTWDETHHDRWMRSGKFQGDIAGVDLEMKLMQNEAADPTTGLFYNAIRSRHMQWSNGVIPYIFDSRYSTQERRILQGAMDEYAQRTCVRFVPRTTERDYLNIIKGYGCYSHVGRTGGRQELSLGFGCGHHEVAVHELMHAVGFWHEHSRADRDENIVIMWHNIAPGMSSQFDKIRPDIQDLLGEPYDYLSVMHYDRRAYSRNGHPTIQTVRPEYADRIGRAKGLSEVDVRKINKLYNCPQINTGPNPGNTVLPIVTQTAAPPTPQPIVPPQPNVISNCRDKFSDCSAFSMYCFRVDFVMVMRTFCPSTCGAC